MKIGVVFPQTEIGTDSVAIRDFLQAAEELGYHHLSQGPPAGVHWSDCVATQRDDPGCGRPGEPRSLAAF